MKGRSQGLALDIPRTREEEKQQLEKALRQSEVERDKKAAAHGAGRVHVDGHDTSATAPSQPRGVPCSRGAVVPNARYLEVTGQVRVSSTVHYGVHRGKPNGQCQPMWETSSSAEPEDTEEGKGKGKRKVDTSRDESRNVRKRGEVCTVLRQVVLR